MIVACAVHARPSTDSTALLAGRVRTWVVSLSTGVWWCCARGPTVAFVLVSSSPRLDVLGQQRVVTSDFIRMLSGNVIVNVFKSGAVMWWAAIFLDPSSMFDKMLQSKSQGFAICDEQFEES